MVTGGGAYNTHLINSMISHLGPNTEIIIPDKETIEFKEAIIFAFLGLLRLRNDINCFASVTGASQDSCTGSIIGNIKFSN